MAATGFHLVFTLLASSHLVFMANAISTSGNIHRHMLHEKVEIKNQQMVNVKETAFLDDAFMSERMDLEKTDYPGAGPNKGHTPKPPQRD